MRYSILSLLVLASCGASPEKTSSTSSIVTTDGAAQTNNTCDWIASTYSFHTYGEPSATPPTPRAGVTWEATGLVFASAKSFTATLDVDANNAPWVSLTTSDGGLYQETCPSFIDVGSSRFSFQLVSGEWFGVTIVTGSNPPETVWAND